ncbi:MAG: glutamate--tRNA ligase [Nitrospinae bacterium]|nr:glutamate--tRNA ligase [Nitrospinota bacterium]MBL7019765.1 glutamate--tRNA ligase [Nitrospinaceae bacterium]
MSESVKVRFAPSPTGFLHIGGVRTALFNWLFARHHGGQFVLRIEDTDHERSTEESIAEILESMRWLGLDWDEGPYRQTERQELYTQKVDQLFKAGKAYRCYCTPEELDKRRAEAQKKGLKPKYDGTCRERADQPEGVPSVIRFKAPLEGSVVVEDLLRGKIVFDITELDDLILQRTDGSPTYNFVVVVDDADMGITHVVRGDDHLSNTPRQCLLYDALSFPRPRFAHISMILGQDKTRLSKRHGATSALVYRDMGFLPSAMINYLARLGWSHGDQEIFSREEMVQLFSFDSVHTSAAVFDPDKLSWLNEHYIKNTPPEELARHLEPFLISSGILQEGHGLGVAEIAKVIPSLNQRAKTLVEMAEKSAFYFKKEVEFDEKAKAKFLTAEARPLLEKAIAGLSRLDDFSVEKIEVLFKQVVEEEGTKLGKLAQPVRVALTGTTVSPGIYDVILLLGKEETLNRLNQALP